MVDRNMRPFILYVFGAVLVTPLGSGWMSHASVLTAAIGLVIIVVGLQMSLASRHGRGSDD